MKRVLLYMCIISTINYVKGQNRYDENPAKRTQIRAYSTITNDWVSTINNEQSPGGLPDFNELKVRVSENGDYFIQFRASMHLDGKLGSLKIAIFINDKEYKEYELSNGTGGIHQVSQQDKIPMKLNKGEVVMLKWGYPDPKVGFYFAFPCSEPHAPAADPKANDEDYLAIVPAQ